MPTDIEIARRAKLRPIAEVAAALGLGEDALESYGRSIAKVDPTAPSTGRQGKLILVTSMTPTPAGEGKTTTTIGLGDGLNRIGKQAVVCLREPSLGPCFGVKGGATGGGYAQVVPMERINLHFTGDFHAVTSAHNLLAALVDNHLHWGNGHGLDARRISWRRVVDMNDRALRRTVVGLGGVTNGFPREDGFDITVASEVMAVLCLAEDLHALEHRLGRIVVGDTGDRRHVTAVDLDAAGAMTVLLQDAFRPNLVQTLEGNPAFVHGGPFANIAHGCSSLVATRAALALADYVVTEAGFGADLGAEKFFDVKCRQGALAPAAVVVVATVRALKMHGGVAKEALGHEDVEALRRGMANLARHVGIVRRFGLEPVVSLNRFATDGVRELALVQAICRDELGVVAFVGDHWARGSAGIEALAAHVAERVDAGPAEPFRLLYPDDASLSVKLRTIATTIYGAADVALDDAMMARLDALEAKGYGGLQICVAKTPYSFSTDPSRRGAPSGHVVTVRELRLSAGAGFVVAICGDVATMPGLPRRPAAHDIRLDAAGHVVGLF